MSGWRWNLFRPGGAMVRLAAIGMLTTLVGCVDPVVVRQADSPDDPFLSALFVGYLNLADIRATNGQSLNASFYAYKARVAARGDTIGPEKLDTWKINSDEQLLMIAARARLTTSLTESQRKIGAVHAAHAQVMFDCWLELQESGLDAKPCREQFWQSLAQLDEDLATHRTSQSMQLPLPSERTEVNTMRSTS